MLEAEFEQIGRVLAKDLFFIAATEKSGTTWLQALIDAHPHAACRGEGQFFTRLAPKLAEAVNDYHKFVTGLNRKVFAETDGFPTINRDHYRFLARSAVALILAEYGDDPAVTCVGEKTPGTVRALKHMKELFPRAKVVFILRDGRDAAVSGWIHIVRQWGPDKGKEPLDRYTRRFAKVWRQDYESAQRFAAAHPGDFHQLKYEDLHAAPVSTLKGVFRFLGLDDDDTLVARCLEAASFENLSGGRERGQEDRGSQFRKGVVGDWRNHFDAAAIEVFYSEAGELLRRLGYPDAAPAGAGDPDTAADDAAGVRSSA